MKIKLSKRNINLVWLPVAFALAVIINEGLLTYGSDWISYQNYSYSEIPEFRITTKLKALIVSSGRAVDSSLDSLLSLKNETFRSSKGLFWESSKSNSLQGSFLTTLTGGVPVGDGFTVSPANCEQLNCFFEQAVRYSGVNSLFINEHEINYISEEKKKCWNQLVTNGTASIMPKQIGIIPFQDRTYNVYYLQARAGALATDFMSQAEPVKFENVLPVDQSEYGVFGQLMKVINQQCEKNSSVREWPLVTVEDQSRSKMQNIVQPAEIKDRSGEEVYKYSLPAEKSWYALKVSPLPGLFAMDSEGHELPLYKSYPFILVYGAGQITLYYQRTQQMLLSYLISLASILAAILFFFKARCNYLANPSPNLKRKNMKQ